MAPVPQGIEIAHVEAFLKPFINPRQASCDLAGHEGFTTPGALVVKQDAVAGIHAVGLAIVHRDPVGVQLGHPIGASWIEGSALFLGHLLHEAIELTGAGLVDPGCIRQSQDPHGLQDPEGAEGIAVGGVLRRLKAHRHMALCTKVVDLIGLHLLDDSNQVGAVGEVPVMEHQPRITLMRILIEMINSVRVEATGPALDSMYLVSLLEKKFGQIAAVLAGDSCDYGLLH